MTLDRETPYPSQRTYVLKLSGEAHANALHGRLENLVTGRQQAFASSAELLSLIARDLGGAAATDRE